MLPELYNLGTRINYEVAGEGDTTLLFVHGWCINQTYWSNQIQQFKDQYRVVTLDLPGHGQSGKDRDVWSIENFGGDVALLMEALSLKNVVLIGHSMGGNIILEAASRKPDAVIGFVGVDNFKDFGMEPSEEEMEEVAVFLKQIRDDYSGVMQQYARGMLFSENTPDDISNRVMQDVLSTPEDISINILESLWMENEAEIRQMQELQVKVHLINCNGYPTNEHQLEKYCGASYEIHPIGDLSHYPMIEAPDTFNAILDEIIKKL